MADVIRKRVTLHPLKKNGQMDLNVNLYPKCFVDGVVDRNGNPVNVVVSNEPGVSIEQVVTQLEAEIAEHGGVTPEDLEEVLQGYATVEVVDSIAGHVSDLAAELGTVTTEIGAIGSDIDRLETEKQDIIADLASIRAGATAGAAAVSQDDFNNAIDEIDDHITVIAENQLPCWKLNFSLHISSYQTDVPQPDENEPWMHSEDTYDNQLIILSINGGTPEFCFISKSVEGDNNDHIHITLYNNRWYIEMTYIPSEVQFDWTLDLSGYFGNKMIRDDFYPAIRFIDSELDDDNVIMPSWAQDIDARIRVFTRIEVPAILYTDDNNVGEPVTIYAIPDINDDDLVAIHVRSSEGDYKLTYQYHEDEEGE